MPKQKPSNQENPQKCGSDGGRGGGNNDSIEYHQVAGPDRTLELGRTLKEGPVEHQE